MKLPFSENLGHTEHACLLTKLHTFLASAGGFIVESTIHSKRQFIIFGGLPLIFPADSFIYFVAKTNSMGGWGGIPGLCSPAFLHPSSIFSQHSWEENPTPHPWATWSSNPVSVSGLVPHGTAENTKTLPTSLPLTGSSHTDALLGVLRRPSRSH